MACGASVHPEVDRSPRVRRIAIDAEGVARLTTAALEIQGGRAIPLAGGLGVVALLDGSLLALGEAANGIEALHLPVGGEPVRALSWAPPTAKTPILLPDAEGFWFVADDRKTATRHGLGLLGDRLHEGPTVALGALDRTDVVRVGGDFALMIGSRLSLVASERRTLAELTGRTVNALALGPGGLWVADHGGGLSRVGLVDGSVERVATLPGAGVALAADSTGLVALSATFPPGGTKGWQLTAFEAGEQRWQISGEGDPGRGLAVSTDRVALGDEAQLRVVDRASGK